MNQRAFTLIELLAVIVIIGVISLITVPVVTRLINENKMDVFKTHEKALETAAESYMSVNQNKLPEMIDETTEVTLQELIDTGFIKPMTSPNNKKKQCSGYVLVTQEKENVYVYTPHLNCIEDIGSAEDDGLVLHYKFDDFQEPTENYIPNGHFSNGQGVNSESGSNPVNEVVELKNPGDSEWVLRQTSVVHGSVNTEYEIHFQDGTEIKKNTSYTMSCWVAYTPDWNGNYQLFHSRVYYADGTNYSTTGSGTLLKSVEFAGLLWEYRSHTFTTLDKDIHPTSRFSWYLGYSANNTAGYRYITNIQIEEKLNATPFVDGIRTGVVKDYSSKGNSSLLQLNTTPRWVVDSKIGEGAYEFKKGTDVISVKGALNNVYETQMFSWGCWVKLDNNFDTSGRLLMSQTNVLELTINSSRRALVSIKDSEGWKNPPSSEPLEVNKWHHIFATSDGIITKLYINGEQYSKVETLGFLNPSNNIYIGNWSSNQHFNGLIDDVRIYNRALSDEEVMFMYERYK